MPYDSMGPSNFDRACGTVCFQKPSGEPTPITGRDSKVLICTSDLDFCVVNTLLKRFGYPEPTRHDQRVMCQIFSPFPRYKTRRSRHLPATDGRGPSAHYGFRVGRR